MTDRIDHAHEAVTHIKWAHEIQERQGELDDTVRDDALIAQAYATLALAEQQRIANLIAVLPHLEGSANDQARGQIFRALGVDQ